EEFRALTAGFVKLEVVEENWNGFEFYIKAKGVVDPRDVHRKINEVVFNEAENTLLRRQLIEQEEVVETLRSELLAINEALFKSKSEHERDKISQAYLEKSKDINENDYYEVGLNFTWGIRGENIDDAEAVKWYAKAAELGHERALYNLSLAYYEGRGVP